MRYVSVFSGVEAATLAWEALGWEPVCFCEIDDFPSAVLKARWPNVPNLGDITKVDWKEVKRAYGAADLVVGGSPCQSFSIAGDRTGLDGASGLMWEYVRAIRELMPRWLLWENVPGALSSSNGEDFGCLLRELDALGYGLAWRVLDAQFFGVPQRRERLFVVGSLGDAGAQRACEVLFEPESLPWDLASSREKRKELAARAGGGADCAYIGGDSAASVSVGMAGSLPSSTGGIKPGGVFCMTDSQPNCMKSKDLCGALSTTMSKDPPIVSIGAISDRVPDESTRRSCGGGKGPLIQEEISGTVATRNDQTLFQQREETGYIVRRLTPLEAERLQGMPDNHTKVPYRGKPADECPDTPRYRAIGNSMCVSVMRWIGERIQMVEETWQSTE